MKNNWTILLSFCFCLMMYGTAFAEKVVSDNFNDSHLVFRNYNNIRNYYNIDMADGFETSGREIGVKRTAYAKTPYLNEEPEIVEQGPLNQDWVFSTGSSTIWRGAHWQHFSGIVYDFDQDVKNISITLKYLNTRACGGRIRVVFNQLDESGNVVWGVAKNLYHWETWPGPYNSKDRNINHRVWQSLSISSETIERITEGRPIRKIYFQEWDITSEQGSGYFDDIEIHAEPIKSDCVAYIDTSSPTGAIHAHNNLLWPPNNKEVPVVLNGYVVDELSIAKDGQGVGISSAYIIINDEKIVLLDEEIDLLDESGYFEIEVKLTASKNARYDISLFAADTNPDEDGGPNSGLVDSTYVEVPDNMSLGNSKK